ncbi:proline iminopeptidase [Deinococcus irradiatisoli]|uniref:Proline iminopeptidase n=1 Tax=Deinococcus irradiatisoli TaxID=2202254 RepID=A0A2Z3JA53_9DEIO|nr:alpha/beta hydrolase [Deinococcus irradiatisoli]AWN21872.1 proline iminopeptidase [Deinococcus irradiatisoli]
MDESTQTYFEHLNGADLYFEVAEPQGLDEPGSAEAAPTLIYLHGGPGYNALTFRDLVGERLGAYRVIYLDQRGAGRSGPLDDTEQGGETLDLDTLTADVEAVRDFLGIEQLTPLGHGFGALIALEYARRFPTRTHRAVVVNPWVHFPDLALTLLEEASARRNMALDDPRAELVARTPEGQHPPVGAARIEAAFKLLNARDLLNALHFKDAPTRMRLEFADVEGQLMGGAEVQQALVNQGLWEFEYPPFLTEIRRQVYVIAGTHDATSYPVQVQWLEDLADADVTLLDAGHYPWLDDEDAFIEALEDALRR